MSWHIEVCGKADDVKAAIDESVASSGGMPKEVGDYLKGAVDSCDLKDGALVRVKSNGHRPMQGFGSQEECVVQTMRSGPWPKR